jgi:zinc protease
MYGAAFKVHPYRWPVIGYMTDLDNISLEKANQFYRTYYSPNNAVVVIAGDFDPAQAKALVTKYYGHLKSQEIPSKPRPAEPAQSSARTQMVERDVQSTQFAIAYHTPKAGSEEAYALDLLANIMGYGPSSRLYNRLVYKEQQAAGVAAYNLTLQEAGLFQIFVTMKPGMASGKAQKSVIAEMWRPRNLPIKDAELEKAKNQVMKSYVDALKTVHGKAEALALNETMYGDYERLFKDLENYNKVTAAQVKKAAQKYLVPERATIVVLKPKAKGAR